MSRHEIPALHPEMHRVIVGWDQLLMSYFAQVIDRKKEEDGEDDILVLWVGASLPRLYEIDDLQRALCGYAHLSQEIRTTLYRDKVWEPQPPQADIHHCPVCGSTARVWQYAEKEGDPVRRVVMCTNGDRIGPQDGLLDGCLLFMPPDQFYRSTTKDALRYWNEFAVALEVLRESIGTH